MAADVIGVKVTESNEIFVLKKRKTRKMRASLLIERHAVGKLFYREEMKHGRLIPMVF